jgi:hypothetical protein
MRCLCDTEDAIKLQQDLDAAGKWEQDWLMHFHPDKCTVVSVTQKVTGILLDVPPSRITVCVLSVRKSFIQ